MIVASCPKKEIFPVASTLSGVIFTAISEILSTSFANNWAKLFSSIRPVIVKLSAEFITNLRANNKSCTLISIFSPFKDNSFKFTLSNFMFVASISILST